MSETMDQSASGPTTSRASWAAAASVCSVPVSASVIPASSSARSRPDSIIAWARRRSVASTK